MAVAATLRRPGKQVVAFMGDGGTLMMGNEIATACQYGGNPIVITGDNIRMAATADAEWVWVDDNSGNLYGYTIDPSVPAVAVRRAYRHPRPNRINDLPRDR